MHSSESVSVCLCACACVCMCVQNILNSYKQLLIKFYEEVDRRPQRNRLYFDGDLDSFVDPGSFSVFLFH